MLSRTSCSVERTFRLALRWGHLVLFLMTAGAAGTSVFSEPEPCLDRRSAPICEALRIPDPSKRFSEVRRTLEEALASPEPEARRSVGQLVSKLRARVDWRPFSDLLAAGCGTDPSGCLWRSEDTDWTLLTAGSREERLGWMERAIRAGSVRLPGGLALVRRTAVKMAADQGLEELRPLAEEFLATLTPTRIERLGLGDIPGVFELRAGSATALDAPRWAVTRLHAMPDDVIVRKMDDRPFRLAAIAAAGRVCDIDPLWLHVPPECSLIVELADRIGRAARSGERDFAPSVPESARDAADWRERLRSIARRTERGSNRAVGFPSLGEPVHARGTDYRRGGLDPCGLPDLTSVWTQGSYAHVISLVDVTEDRSGSRVAISTGIRGRRSGERMRLRLEVTDRQGRPAEGAVVVQVSLEGDGAGRLSHVGSIDTCSKLVLLWNDAVESGQRRSVEREFDLVLGRSAGVAALLPANDPQGPLEPWWRSAGTLLVRTGHARDDGERVDVQSDRSYALRTESLSVPSVNPLVEVMEALRRSNSKSAFLNSELEDRDLVVRYPSRAFLVLLDGNEQKDVLVLDVRTSRSDGRTVDHARVPLRRLRGTDLFVGSFTAIPEKYPFVDCQRSPDSPELPSGADASTSPPATSCIGLEIPLGSGKLGAYFVGTAPLPTDSSR